MIARVAPLLVIICLLSGWQSALLHPLQHTDSDGRLVHVDDGHSKQRGGSSSDPAAKLCDALAALTACAGEAPAAVADIASAHAVFFHHSGAPRAAAAPPFFAQGPPPLL